MPVVPQVDVNGAGAAEEEKDEIDTKTDGDDERADKGVIGYRGCGRPAHIEHLKLKTVDLYNL